MNRHILGAMVLKYLSGNRVKQVKMKGVKIAKGTGVNFIVMLWSTFMAFYI